MNFRYLQNAVDHALIISVPQSAASTGLESRNGEW
jgi:hypothetical protein